MEVKPSNVLTWGILALAFCGTGILGIIFGAIGKSKAKAYVNYYGETTGQVKAGSIMSKIGFILGIVCAVCFTIIIIAAIAGGGSYYYY